MRRYRVRPHTWYCVECAKEGRAYVYVPNAEHVCPFGHRSKTRGYTSNASNASEHEHPDDKTETGRLW